MNNFDVVVVGAGPAGLLAAGRAAELGNKVLVLEKMERPGRKLLITGKGRCNVTNDAEISDFITKVKPKGRFLRNAFSGFYSKDIIELLDEYGVELLNLVIDVSKREEVVRMAAVALAAGQAALAVAWAADSAAVAAAEVGK